MLRPSTGRGQAHPDSGVLSGISPGLTAWNLVQTISPRTHVRTPIKRHDGAVDPTENTYPHTHQVTSHDPQVPWAMFLAGTDGAYRFLVFDFDAHSHPLEQARSDTAAFTQLLDDLVVDYVECESSPGDRKST